MDLEYILESIKKKIEVQKEKDYFSCYKIFQRKEFKELKNYFLKNFSGQKLCQIFNGKIKFNSRGKFIFISLGHKLCLKKPDYDFGRQRLLGSLCFLEGIREITETKLKQKGYKMLKDLISCPRFSERAGKVYEILNRAKIEEIISLCDFRFSKSDLIYILLSALFELKDFLFLDIETLGLFSGNIIFLVGLAKVDSASIQIFQYLARFPEEEPALLEELIQEMNKSRVLVSYNGKCFDLPFIEHRAFFCNLSLIRPLLHLDLLHFARRNFKSLINRFKLTDIETELIKKERFLDVPSEYVPLLYKGYLATGEEAYLIPILIHNRNDLITLVELLNLFYQKLCP